MRADALPLPPGPRARFPGELFWKINRDPLGFLAGLSRDHGDVSFFKLGARGMAVVNHPDMIKAILVTDQKKFTKGGRFIRATKKILGEGLFTSEGELHHRQRRLMMPAFHSDRIRVYAEEMVKASETLGQRWERRAADPACCDILQDMLDVTLDILGRTLLGNNLGDATRQIAQAFDDILPLIQRMRLPFGPLIDELPLPSNRRRAKAKAALDALVDGLIGRHRAGEGAAQDIVSMLLTARDEAGEAMNDAQLRDEILTILIAGHETTALALSYAWFLLSQHPEIARRLHEEIDLVLEGRRPTLEDVPRLKLAERIFAEAMRLYPPLYVLVRMPIVDYALGGYQIPAGTIVHLSPWIMQRDPRYFPEPERFDPDRWLPEARDARPKFSYFPFSGGPRGCIGEAFAWMEGVLVLCTLAQHWSLRYAGTLPLRLTPVVSLRPKGGMPMIISRRSTHDSVPH